MFLPVLIYYIVFRYGPMLGLSIAFKKYDLIKGFTGSKWVGFKYFQQFFNSIYVWRLLRNTLLINLYTKPPVQENGSDHYLYAVFYFQCCTGQYGGTVPVALQRYHQ